jgi:hypothetical protein
MRHTCREREPVTGAVVAISSERYRIHVICRPYQRKVSQKSMRVPMSDEETAVSRKEPHVHASLRCEYVSHRGNVCVST